MKVKTSRSRNVVMEMKPGDVSLPPCGLAELRLKHILVPVDFSECSHKALQYAYSFARQFSSEILLLHVVVAVPPPPQMLVFESESLRAKYHEEAAKQLAQWRREMVPQTSVKAVVRAASSAHQEIVEAAHDCNCDLIIMGNHGRSGLARMLTGSTAERVVRHAPCPVLVVREREREFLVKDTSGLARKSEEVSGAE
jgi:nucleotide-binding universal stress UspA family protein